jgi:hypothetical protein
MQRNIDVTKIYSISKILGEQTHNREKSKIGAFLAFRFSGPFPQREFPFHRRVSIFESPTEFQVGPWVCFPKPYVYVILRHIFGNILIILTPVK